VSDTPVTSARWIEPWFAALAIGWGWLIHALTVAPVSQAAGPESVEFMLNGGHGFLFAVLGFLLGHGFPRLHSAIVVLLCSAFGWWSEWLQNFIEGRSPDVWDWVTDTSGAIFGVAVLALWFAWRRRGGTPREAWIAAGVSAVVCLASTALATWS